MLMPVVLVESKTLHVKSDTVESTCCDLLKCHNFSGTPNNLGLNGRGGCMMTFARIRLLAPFGSIVVRVSIHWHNQLVNLDVPLNRRRISNKYMGVGLQGEKCRKSYHRLLFTWVKYHIRRAELKRECLQDLRLEFDAFKVLATI